MSWLESFVKSYFSILWPWKYFSLSFHSWKEFSLANNFFIMSHHICTLPLWSPHVGFFSSSAIYCNKRSSDYFHKLVDSKISAPRHGFKNFHREADWLQVSRQEASPWIQHRCGITRLPQHMWHVWKQETGAFRRQGHSSLDCWSAAWERFHNMYVKTVMIQILEIDLQIRPHHQSCIKRRLQPRAPATWSSGPLGRLHSEKPEPERTGSPNDDGLDSRSNHRRCLAWQRERYCSD